MPTAELLSYILLVFGLAITPGPNMLLYLSHSFAYGRRAGWQTVLGITTAFLFHIAAVLLGLTTVLMASPGAFTLLKLAGAGYLLFLAFKIAWANPIQPGKPEPVTQNFSFYSKGFLGNLLNPQTALLYFSLLPQFIHPERGQANTQVLRLGLIQMLVSTLTNLSLVALASNISAEIYKNTRLQRRIRIVMGVLLGAFAIRLLFS